MSVEPEFDFKPAYKVEGWAAGIAWRVTGYAQEQVGSPVYDENDEYTGWDDYEMVDDKSRVVAHMIGDDQDWTFDVSDLTPLKDEEYCGSCGQVGCGWH